MEDGYGHLKFREKVGPRLRVISDEDLRETPDCVADKMEELRRKERQLLRKKHKLLRLRACVR